MIRIARLMLPVTAALVLAGLSTGCLSVQKPAYAYYSLQPLAEPVEGLAKLSAGEVMSFGPVTLAGYLDRPQMVTRGEGTQIMLSSTHRWAGSLRDNINDVMLNNLMVLLGTDRIVSFPWTANIPIDHQLSVQIHQFEGILGGDVVFRGRWGSRDVLFGKTGKTKLRGQSVELREPAGTTHDEMVMAQSRLLARLAVLIVESLPDAKAVTVP